MTFTLVIYAAALAVVATVAIATWRRERAERKDRGWGRC